MQPRPSADLGLLLIRLMLGAVFLFHGSQKLFGLFGGGGPEGTAAFFDGLGLPAPQAAAILSGAIELLGGLALVLGLLVPLFGALLAIHMLVASLTAHSGFAASEGGMEYPLTLACVCAGLALVGAGRWALGARRRA